MPLRAWQPFAFSFPLCLPLRFSSLLTKSSYYTQIHRHTQASDRRYDEQKHYYPQNMHEACAIHAIESYVETSIWMFLFEAKVPQLCIERELNVLLNRVKGFYYGISPSIIDFYCHSPFTILFSFFALAAIHYAVRMSHQRDWVWKCVSKSWQND